MGLPSPPSERNCSTDSATGAVPTSPSPSAGGELDRALPGHRDQQRRRLVGQRVEAGVLDREVLAAVARQLALPELADHLDRLLEALLALDHPGPAVAEDVLVEVLAAADAEREAARQEAGGGGGGLGDDRRVDPGRRAGDAGDQLDPLGALRDRPQRLPRRTGSRPARRPRDGSGRRSRRRRTPPARRARPARQAKARRTPRWRACSRAWSRPASTHPHREANSRTFGSNEALPLRPRHLIGDDSAGQ